MSDEKKTDNYAETAFKIAGALAEKTVVPIYEDLAKPSVKQIGEGLGGFLSLVMMPFQIMGLKAEHWKSEFRKSLDRKASKIPLENLQAPDPIIAGPIMQALGYTVHKEPLREMFTSLLTTAMNSEKADHAHPAFVDIIKQLSVDEAKILQFFSKDNSNFFASHAVVDVKFTLSEDLSFTDLLKNQSYIPEDAGCSNFELGAEYLENLERLKLIEISSDGSYLKDLSGYQRLEEWFKGSDFSKLMSPYAISLEEGKFELVKKRVTVSFFGRQFLKICVMEVGIQGVTP